jgi:hypothetical protein
VVMYLIARHTDNESIGGLMKEAMSMTSARCCFFLCSSTPSSVFIIDADPILPAALTSFIRLLLLTQEEWEKTQEKGRPPKAKFDLQVSSLLQRIFELRLTSYQSPDLEVRSSNHCSIRRSVTRTLFLVSG